jgi:hypothetical protein
MLVAPATDNDAGQATTVRRHGDLASQFLLPTLAAIQVNGAIPGRFAREEV